MSDETKHGNAAGNGGFEHQDLAPGGILYFLLALGIATALCMFGLRGLYAFLDHHEKMSQPGVNPLVTNIPEDTRHVAPGYPQQTFPSPKLEEDERGQLNGIRLNEEKTLYSYGWVDEKAGTVRIPIERAMDLIVQRGLPVRPQGTGSGAASAEKKEISKAGNGKPENVGKDKKK
ncbi:MAG: hypothetical protein WAN65_08625 [Candidatus Sulfotelmatobacter sp.]